MGQCAGTPPSRRTVVGADPESRESSIKMRKEPGTGLERCTGHRYEFRANNLRRGDMKPWRRAMKRAGLSDSVGGNVQVLDPVEVHSRGGIRFGWVMKQPPFSESVGAADETRK